MNSFISFGGILVLFLMGPVSLAQDVIRISDPELELKDNIVYITYDFLNSRRNVNYAVRLEVTDAAGQVIHAKALAGDIGENISGGRNKQITWDLTADSIFIDSEIFFTVYASQIVPEEPVVVLDDQSEAEAPPGEQVPEDTQEPDDGISDNVTVPDQTVEEQQGIDEETTKGMITGPVSEEERSGQRFNRTAIMLQSLAFPGLGLSRVKGKPHWLRGVAGYGCIAGSMVYRKKANASLADHYAADRDDWQAYYQDVAAWQEQISMTFAAAAVGIWISDIVWTFVGTSGLKKRPMQGADSGLSVSTGFEPLFAIPTVGVKYRF